MTPVERISEEELRELIGQLAGDAAVFIGVPRPLTEDEQLWAAEVVEADLAARAAGGE